MLFLYRISNQNRQTTITTNTAEGWDYFINKGIEIAWVKDIYRLPAFDRERENVVSVKIGESPGECSGIFFGGREKRK